MNNTSKMIVAIIYTSLSLSACGKLKTSDDTTLGSTSPEKIPVSATQIFTDTGLLLGNFLGLTTGLNPNSAIFAQFPDGSFAQIDFTWGQGSIGILMGITPTFMAQSFTCYYSSSDCSGHCYIASGSFLKNSLTYDGTNYQVYTGQEASSTLTTNYSHRTFDSLNGPNLVPSSCSSTASGSVNVVIPSRVWTPPDGVTFPISGFSFGK